MSADSISCSSKKQVLVLLHADLFHDAEFVHADGFTYTPAQREMLIQIDKLTRKERCTVRASRVDSEKLH